MTGITHIQARRYINALADDLIRDQEQRILSEHLSSCDECQAYATELTMLNSKIQKAFDQRRDPSPGPSEKLVHNVQRQTRGTILAHRINIGLRTLTGLTALVILGILISYVFRQLHNSSKATSVTHSPMSAPQNPRRLIAFVSSREGNSEIYVMNADGSGVRNITNNPAYDGNPAWSPDGSRIAFESDRDGNLDIFVMNKDGSGVTQLTHDPANDILGAAPQTQVPGTEVPNVWSPDGNHILFSNDRSGKWALFVMNADGSSVTQLTRANDPPVGGTHWSPDGRQVVYSLGTANGWGQIVAINIDGTNRRTVATGDPAKGDNAWFSADLIGWSQDEKYIYYEYQTGSGTWYVLKAAANGTNTSQEIASGYALETGLYARGWLGSDSGLSYTTEAVGASHGSRYHNMQNGKSIFWDSLVICGYLLPNSSQSFSGDSPITNWAISKTGSQIVLGVSCPFKGYSKGYSELYYLDSKTATINKIAQIPTVWSDINISWSADDQAVLFQGKDKSGKTSLYILSAEDLLNKSPLIPTLIWSGENINAALQPVPSNGLATAPPLPVVPTLQPRPSSTSLWAGTSKGDLIAFDSDANGNPDIYLAKSDGSSITNLTHRSADDFDPVWSPDGNWIAFASGYNGLYSLHIIRPDGSAEKKIGDTWWGYTWSPDSKKIAYLAILPDNSSNTEGPAKTSLKIIDLDGNIIQDTTLGVFYYQTGQLRWSQDGQSLSYAATKMATEPTGETRVTESDIYQINLGGNQPVLLAKSDQQIDDWTGTARNLTYLARDILTWNLIHTNGQSKTQLATWDPVPDQCKSSAPFNWDNVSSPASRRWSPDGKSLLIETTCPDDNTTWLYLGNINGAFVKLLNYPVLSNSIGQDSVSWSPDGQSIIFSADLDSVGNLDLYVLNVDTALKDPSTRPVRITTSGFMESSPAWEPKP